MTSERSGIGENLQKNTEPKEKPKIKKEKRNEEFKNTFFAVLKDNGDKIVFTFLSFFLLVSITTIYINYVAQKLMYKEGYSVTENVEDRIEDRIAEMNSVFDSLVSLAEIGIEDEELLPHQIEKKLQTYTSRFTDLDYPYADFVYFCAAIDGEFLCSKHFHDSSENYETQEWYTTAMENFSETNILGPDKNNNEHFVFSRALYKNGKSIGVIAAQFTCDGIFKLISEVADSEGRYCVLSDSDGIILASRTSVYIGKKFTQKISQEVPIYNNDEKYIGYTVSKFIDPLKVECVAFINETLYGWTIRIISPRSIYFDDVYSLIISISLIALVLACILSYIISYIGWTKNLADSSSLAKSNFLAHMSHEMRTPINAIIGMTEIAKFEKDPEKIMDCWTNVNVASSHLLGIINDVLDINKIEAGKLEISEINFSMDQLISRLKNVIEFRVDQKSQHLAINIATDVPPVLFADLQRLSQVVINLIGNAVKFTPEGGKITLDISVIEIRGKRANLRFIVKDNGIGISDEQQEKIFDSYEQATSSISRRYGGTGLGLAISKRIVNLMGGQIHVESVINQGSSFIFNVITHIGDPKAVKSSDRTVTQEELTGIFKGKRLLLAEDVELNRQILCALLKPTEIVIDCAANGREAADFFATASQEPNHYDLVFMDVSMPVMDGIESTKQIRAYERKESLAPTAIIAMTADVFSEGIERCMTAGMNDHLSKPIDINIIIWKMKKYLGIK